jgi:hypothetical protein
MMVMTKKTRKMLPKIRTVGPGRNLGGTWGKPGGNLEGTWGNLGEPGGTWGNLGGSPGAIGPLKILTDRHRSKTFLLILEDIYFFFKRSGLLFVPYGFSNLPTALKMRLRKP